VAQAAVTVLVLSLAVGLSLYVDITEITALLFLLLAGLVISAIIWRRHARVAVVFMYPVVAVNMLYVFLELMTYSAYTRLSIPYNVNQQLSGQADLPVYVYQLDPIVAWELGIYRAAPSLGISDPSQLPKDGSDFYLVASDAKLQQLKDALGASQTIVQGAWVDHKTGTLPRQLKLAKGTEPLEKISVLRVVARADAPR
jgi:hypothetical protein